MAARVPSLALVTLFVLLQPLPALAARWNGTAIKRAMAQGAPRAIGAHGAAARGPAGAGVESVPDGAGGLYLVWSDERDGSLDVYLLRVTSTGAVATGWPADGLPVCDAPGDQTEPILFSDGSNGVICGWADARDSWKTPDAYAQRVNSAGTPQWAANGVKVITDVSRIGDAHAVGDGGGGALIAWSAPGSVDKDIFALRITGAGGVATGWDAAGTLVCDATDSQSRPSVASDGAGGAIIAWEDGRAGSGQANLFAQRLNGSGAAQWTGNGVQLDGGTSVYQPAVLADGAGGAFVYWVDYTASTVMGQRVNAAGMAQWTAGGVTVGGASASGDIKVAPDGAGGTIVGWFESGVSATEIRAQRVSGAGASQWTAAGVAAISSSTANPSFDDLISDGAGAAYLSWTDYRNGFDNSDIYAQRISSAGTVSWTPNGQPATAAAGNQANSTIAPDGSGGVLVSWIDLRTLDIDIFAQRFNAAGTPQLAPDGVAAYTGPGVQLGSLALHTDDGGALVFWNEKLNGQYDIRGLKVSPDGSPAGPTATICGNPNNQLLAAVVDDGAGGAIVAWTDWRNGSPDIYAQRVNGSVAPQWTLNGVAVCAFAGDQGFPKMVTDGAGGAILAWDDNRAASTDIYAQRLTALGVPQWTSNGVAVCTDPGGQFAAALAPDGAGGAIIGWADFRSFIAPAVYAQRVNSAGLVQWTGDGVKIASYGLSSFPSVSGVVPAPSNNAIVLVNQTEFDAVSGARSSILSAQKVDGSGTALWGTAGATICDAGGIAGDDRMVDDGAGGAYVAWTDGRGDVADIYMQRLDPATGAGLWTANGNAVCNASGWQRLGGLTRFPGGNLYLTWTDNRSGQADIYAHQVSTSGADVWAANGVAVCTAARGQFFSSPAPLKDTPPFRLYVTWTDNRSGDARYVFIQRLDASGASLWTPDGNTGTELSLVSSVASPDGVHLVWAGPSGVETTIYRRTADSDWRVVAQAVTDASGLLTYEDRDVVAGTRYGYRVGVRQDAGEVFLGEVWIGVPSGLALALEGLSPNPAIRDFTVAFTLPTSDPARLEVLDVSGRRVVARDLQGLPPGRHTLRLDHVKAPGMYFMRLTQRGKAVTARGVVVH